MTMIFLTKNGFIGGADTSHREFVTWVNCTQGKQGNYPLPMGNFKNYPGISEGNGKDSSAKLG